MAGAAPGAGLRRAARHVREVTAAPFWRRVLADLIDLSALLAVMALAFKLGIWGWPTLPERLYDPLDYAVEILIHHAARFTPIVLLLSALHLGARLLSYLTWGRTLGQRLLGLR
ncbi:RDD family protein, partial [Myxococcota bacterium]|nr:RDD family protein [Myxococcota bacterium]